MKIVIALFSFLLIIGCQESKDSSVKAELTLLNLVKKFADRNLEISGMDWYQDRLFFLNQIPSKYNDKIFFSTRAEILKCIRQADSLMLHDFDFKQKGVAELLGSIPDYEAIAFYGDSVFLLIETEDPMRGFLIQGLISQNNLTVNPLTLTEIPLNYNLPEIACEALLIYKQKIYVFYEANGANINSNPQVFCYDLSLNQRESVAIDPIEYRITDATKIKKENSFWILNHFWPGEMALLNPAEEKFLPSTYHNNENGVNRLIQLEMRTNQIKIKSIHPLMLSGKGWNWEALVAFDNNSFLIANDEFSTPPNRTGLGYIKIIRDE